MTTEETYLFVSVNCWLYDMLNSGRISVHGGSMDGYVEDLKARFKRACDEFDNIELRHIADAKNKKPSHPVPCKTSSPILERLMQCVTPETLAKAERVMIQEVIENKTAEYEARFKRFEGPEETETLKPRVYGYNDGLNDMFAFLEDLIK